MTMNDRPSANAPFEITLSLAGRTIVAVIRNCSPAPQKLLYDIWLQPSTLILTDRSGQEVRAFDEREVMKYDNTVFCRRFATLPPGKEMPLGESRTNIAGRAGDFLLYWAEFTFTNLKPGYYTAKVVWESRIDECINLGSRSDIVKHKGPLPIVKMGNIWKGKVVSNEIEAHLP